MSVAQRFNATRTIRMKNIERAIHALLVILTLVAIIAYLGGPSAFAANLGRPAQLSDFIGYALGAIVYTVEGIIATVLALRVRIYINRRDNNLWVKDY